MSNILSYGVSIPRFQIENNILHPEFGKRPGKRTIIFSDEDPITLAFDAASICLHNYSQCHDGHAANETLDAVIFASTTPVFRNRYHASFLAELLELQPGILAFDLTSSVRSGSDALLLGAHLLATNNFQKILVLAADTYFHPIGHELKPVGREGHAGVALLIGNEEGLAKIISKQSTGSFLAEEFNYKGNPVRLDARFGKEAGFKSNLNLALNTFFESNARKPHEFDKVILNSLYARNAAGLFKKRGFDIENQLFSDNIKPMIGLTGACHCILLLLNSLENNSGSTLLIDYHNGTNVFEIEQTKQINADSLLLPEQLNNKTPIASYQDYLTLRKVGNINSKEQKQEIFSSDMMLEREKKNVLHLKGFQCKRCNIIYFIKAQRCKKCKGEDFTLKKLAKTGVIFSYTKEHFFPSSFSPVTMVVVDLDRGGRLTLQVTDEMYPQKTGKTLIGTKAKLVLRKMMENDSKPNYFWKCKL